MCVCVLIIVLVLLFKCYFIVYFLEVVFVWKLININGVCFCVFLINWSVFLKGSLIFGINVFFCRLIIVSLILLICINFILIFGVLFGKFVGFISCFVLFIKL